MRPPPFSPSASGARHRRRLVLAAATPPPQPLPLPGAVLLRSARPATRAAPPTHPRDRDPLRTTHVAPHLAGRPQRPPCAVHFAGRSTCSAGQRR